MRACACACAWASACACASVCVCVCACVCMCVRSYMYNDKDGHRCSLDLFYQLSSFMPTVESYIGASSTRVLPIKTLTA